MTHLSDLIAALRKGDGNGCERSNWLMREAADALMANQGAIVNSIIERTRHEATDDEREALANMIPLDLVHDRGREGFPKDVFEVADHILAAGFHRSEPQGEPSDAQVEAAFETHRNFPGDYIDLSSAAWQRDRMRAALRAAGEVNR